MGVTSSYCSVACYNFLDIFFASNLTMKIWSLSQDWSFQDKRTRSISALGFCLYVINGEILTLSYESNSSLLVIQWDYDLSFKFLKSFQKPTLFSFIVHSVHFPPLSGLRQVPLTVCEKNFPYLILMIHSESNSGPSSVNVCFLVFSFKWNCTGWMWISWTKYAEMFVTSI